MSRLPEDLDRLLHDLRGPLNAIAMHAEVVKRAVRDDPVATESLKTIHSELDRLAGMLAVACEVVAIEPRERCRVNLRVVVERALAEGELKDVAVEEGGWADVAGDPVLLARAVGHLVQNALESSAAAGPATPPPLIRAERRPDGMVGLVVRDFGVGLRGTSPKALIRLRESTKPGHRGVGLFTVERIVRLHGGSLRFDSRDVGAEVALVLPASPA